MGKLCIEVDKKAKIAFISEPLCIGCGICVKKVIYMSNFNSLKGNSAPNQYP